MGGKEQLAHLLQHASYTSHGAAGYGDLGEMQISEISEAPSCRPGLVRVIRAGAS